MRIKLGNFETAATITNENFPFNLVGTLRLDGMPSRDIVRQALDVLQRRHPFLRVRIVGDGKDYFFEDGNVSEIPVRVIVREDAEHWLRIMEHEINHRLDSTRGPLAQCIYLAGENDLGELIFTFHHAIVDGASVSKLLDEFMETCAAIHAGESVEEGASLSPLHSAEDGFPPDFRGRRLKGKMLGYFLRQMGGEMGYRFRARGTRMPPINERTRGRALSIQIPKEITTALVRRSRKERVTLNSALNAAILLGVSKHLYAGKETPLRYMAMANLRPYVKPPVTSGELGGYVAMMRFTAQVSAVRDFWSLAREINGRIHRAFKQGDKYIASALSTPLMRAIFRLRNFRMCTTALSYTGAVQLQPAYGPFRVVGLHGIVSNFGLGPEYVAHVSLFNDTLFWDILYLDMDLSRDQAQRIADEIQAILAQAGAGVMFGPDA